MMTEEYMREMLNSEEFELAVDEYDQPADDQLEEMDETQVLTAVEREIDYAEDFYAEGQGKDAEQAYRFFIGELPGEIDPDIDEFFQDVVSHDVENVIESQLAEILPAMASDRPAEFDALGPGDEDAAALESDICNDILMEAGDGFVEFSTAAKNALLYRLGALEITWEDKADVQYSSAHGVPLAAVGQIVGMEGTEVREVQRAPDAMMDGTIDLEVRSTTRNGYVRVRSANGVLVSTDADTLNFDRARFVAYPRLVSRSDLIAMGYDKDVVDELPAAKSGSVLADKNIERGRTRNRLNSGDPSTDMIDVMTCYYRIDEDGDGIAELRQIVVAGPRGGRTMLDDEPVAYQPFAVGAGYILPGQPYGRSVYDKQKTQQIAKSKFWRVLLEAGQRAARDRVGLMPGTDIPDFQTSTFGGGIKMTQAQGIVPIPNPQFPAQLGMLQEIADKARREGGGGAVDKSGRENLPVEAGAHGVERYMSAIEDVSSMVARLLAETLIAQAYRKIHYLLRTNSPPLTRKVNGQWTTIDPKQWPPREKIGVSVGLTLSERGRLGAAMAAAAAQQMQLIENGSVLANQQTLYRALVGQLRMAGVNNPDSYYVDPASQEGQQAAQAQQQSAQQQQQQAMQAQMAQLQAQGQMLAQVEQAKGQSALQKEALQQQGDAAKRQADMMEMVAQMRQQNQEFIEKMELEYDKLRLGLVGIEAQHGDTGEQIQE